MFVQSCLATTTILFLGVSANDRAVGGHLEALTKAGIDTGSHYWLTHRSDMDTDTWAEQAGIQIIRYEQHSDVVGFFEDIIQYVPNEGPPPPPVRFEGDLESQEPPLPDKDYLLQQNSEYIRNVLNARAKNILGAESSTSSTAYEEFCDEYDEAIYRAWYTSANAPSNTLFGFTLTKEVSGGAFGRVYRAKAPDGTDVAIKILLEEIRRNSDLLTSFRRGVRSMRFLKRRSVTGMVAYKEASEIPAFVVMDWIDGPTLAQAQEAHQLDKWDLILRIGREMTQVVRRAHAIPERVLHRDIRPSNIMLDGYYSQPNDWNVVVLDFDLSWHQGASEQSVVHGAVAGYLAPEQTQHTPNASTRHASVDSFGVGMTLYFMISGKDPVALEHRHEDWNRRVLGAAKKHMSSWKSLPYRYTRLIMRATEHRQADRWDISQIEGELVRLNEAYLDPSSVVSAELLAEELAARCPYEYRWDDDRLMAIIELNSGLQVQISGNESLAKIVINSSWSSKGLHERKRVEKWMDSAVERCVSKLKGAGWKMRVRNVQRSQSVVIDATLGISIAASDLTKQAECVSFVAGELNFE